MAFTAQLGTADSFLGNIELGLGAEPVPTGTASFILAVTMAGTGSATTRVRLTQKVQEVWQASPAPQTRLTQKLVEVWWSPHSPLFLTQKAIEVWEYSAVRVALTQKVFEVWYEPQSIGCVQADLTDPATGPATGCTTGIPPAATGAPAGGCVGRLD